MEYRKLNFLHAAVMAVAMLMPANIVAQQPVKTAAGTAHTPSFERQKPPKRPVKNLADITPVKTSQRGSMLTRYGMSAPRYMTPTMPVQRALYEGADGVTVYGSLIYARSWEQYPDFLPRPFGIYSFTAEDGQMTPTEVAIDNNLYANGGAYVKDGIYSFVNHYTYDGEQYITFYQYDMSTWQLVGEEEGDEDFVAVTLTYNEVEDAVYGIFWSDYEEGYIFDQIDIEDMGGYRYNMGSALDTKIMALASDSEGDVYGIGLDGKLYLMDVDTGDAEEVGELGVTPANYLQSAAFDPRDGRLYWAAQLEDGSSALYVVDTESGETTLVAEFADDEEIVGMWMGSADGSGNVVSYDAPGLVGNITTSFADGQATGTIGFSMPTKTYGGGALSGTVTYTVVANGQQVAEGEAQPGQQVSCTVTLDMGENQLEVYASNDEGDGPRAKHTIWVGDDQPVAPTQVTLAVDPATRMARLTWQAPAEGVHEGYVNPESLTYDVTRYPGAVKVAEGLAATSFEETLPEEEMTVYYYEVKAVNGTQVSKAGRSNTVAVGASLTTPYTEDFAQRAGFDLYTVIDANNDQNTWEYAYGRVRYYAGDKDANDWLMTPNVRLESDRTYKIGFTFNASDDSKMEKISVRFGQGEQPTKMDVMLEPEEFNNTDDIYYEEEITVDMAGDYRMAIQALSEADQGFITVDDVFIVEGTKFAAPAAATDIVVTPAPLGALKADISFKAPLTTYRNMPLDGIQRIEVYRGETLIKEFGKTEPGTTLTLTDEGMPNGANTYRIIAYNEEGAGDEGVKSAWIGIDEPLEPTDIRLADNGNDVTITWNAPGNEGIHGGYVVPADLKYNVYDRMGNSLVRNINAMEYTDRSATLTGNQYILYYYVSATSVGGEGYADASARMVAGTPYSLPFTASFANGGLENKLWWLEGEGRGSWVVTYLEAQDGDGGSAFFAADKAGDIGYLNSGRISLAGADNPGLVFYYDAQPGKTLRLDVYGCTEDGQDRLLRSIDYASLDGEKGWRREFVSLAALKSARYVVLKFKATVQEVEAHVSIDNIQVRDIMTHDLKVAMQAPSTLRLGTENNVGVTIQNIGATVASEYTVRLTANGQEVAAAQRRQLGVGEERTIDFAYLPPVTTEGDVTLQAVVEYEADQDLTNNATQPLVVGTQKPDYPTPENLTASAQGNKVTLAWEKPRLSDGQTTDDFESYDAWIYEGIGNWKVYDGDKAGTLQYSDIWVPNAGRAMAFEVFNTTDEEFETTTRRKFLIAHSGVQYLMAFDPSPSYTDKSDDWLISPLLTGEAQTIRFYGKSCAGNYPETFEVMYSTTDDNPESFINIETFPDVKGGLEWTEYNIPLPEGTKYFAIHVITVDGLAFQLDDITYTPASLVVKGYNVYRDGKLVGSTDKDQTAYTDTVDEDGTHVYQVSVVYTIGESLLSNEATVLTAIRFVDGTMTTIRSSYGSIVVEGAEGKAVRVYATDGKLVAEAGGRQRLDIAVAPGLYLVQVGDCKVNIAVK